MFCFQFSIEFICKSRPTSTCYMSNLLSSWQLRKSCREKWKHFWRLQMNMDHCVLIDLMVRAMESIIKPRLYNNLFVNKHPLSPLTLILWLAPSQEGPCQFLLYFIFNTRAGGEAPGDFNNSKKMPLSHLLHLTFGVELFNILSAWMPCPFLGRVWISIPVFNSSSGPLCVTQNFWDAARERGWWWGGGGETHHFCAAGNDSLVQLSLISHESSSCTFPLSPALGVTRDKLASFCTHLRSLSIPANPPSSGSSLPQDTYLLHHPSFVLGTDLYTPSSVSSRSSFYLLPSSLLGKSKLYQEGDFQPSEDCSKVHFPTTLLGHAKALDYMTMGYRKTLLHPFW